MKQIINISLTILFILSFTIANAQCRQFAVANKKMLKDYIHDGAYTSLSMKPAQNVQFTKTFYRGQMYRLVLEGASTLIKLELRIFDQNQNLIYSNIENGLSKNWEFMVDNTRNLIIMISIPKTENMNVTGCVSVLIGFKSTADLIEEFRK